MLLAQPVALGLDVGQVGRAARGDGLPVEAEAPPHPAGQLPLGALRRHRLQQRTAVPRRAVEDGGRVAGGAHRPELLEELLRVHVLRLVDLQEQVGRRADDVRRGLGAQEGLLRPPVPHDVPAFQPPPPPEARVAQPVPQPAQAHQRLGVEGRRGLHQPRAVLVRQQRQGQLRADLVLPALPRDLDGGRSAPAAPSRCSSRPHRPPTGTAATPAAPSSHTRAHLTPQTAARPARRRRRRPERSARSPGP